MILNYQVGHAFIVQEFGEEYLPTVGWQLDQFGHSVSEMQILAELGMDAVFMARIHYKEKEYRVDNKLLEFVWQPTPQTEIFTHVQKLHYDGPGMLKFDAHSFRAAPIVSDCESPLYNVKDIGELVIYQVEDDKQLFATSHIVYLIGEDFAWENALWTYQNIEEIVDYLNNNSTINQKYLFRQSTPKEYIKAVHQEKHKLTIQKNEEDDLDMFPYADFDENTKNISYWTGYYSSRPNFKKMIRDLSG